MLFSFSLSSIWCFFHIDFVECKTSRNQGSSYWLVITGNGGLYCRALLQKLYFNVGLQAFVVRLWAISDGWLFRPLVLRCSKLVTIYDTFMISVIGFQKSFHSYRFFVLLVWRARRAIVKKNNKIFVVYQVALEEVYKRIVELACRLKTNLLARQEPLFFFFFNIFFNPHPRIGF